VEQKRFVSLDKSELVPQALDLGEIQRRSVYLSDEKRTSEGVTRGGSASSLESTLVIHDDELRFWHGFGRIC